MEFPTQEALKKYLDEHPDADKTKHKVKETKKEDVVDDATKNIPKNMAQVKNLMNKGKYTGKISQAVIKELESGHIDISSKEKAYKGIYDIVSKLTFDTDLKEEMAEAISNYIVYSDADKTKHKVKEEKKEEAPAAAKPHKKTQVRKNTLKNVSKILDEYKINDDSDEMQELAGFKKEVRKNSRIPDKDIGQYYVRNQTKLKKDFLANMDRSNYDTPQEFEAAKKRISQMSPNEFGKVLAAINEDEEIA
jgi:K+/H+ antiporter YhaU regulatory subunit KhtT